MKMIVMIIALVLASFCWATPDNLEQTPAFTPASSPVSDASLAMVRRFGPMYANAGYISWATSDAMQMAVDNTEYSLVTVPAGTTGRNIWYCPNHRRIEVAFENYAVPASGREAILVCDTLFFTSCGNLFITAWRPVCHRVEQPVICPTPQVILLAPPALPEFVPAGPAASIVGIQLVAIPQVSSSASAIAVAVAIVQAAPRAPLSFGKSGLNGRMPYAVGGPGMVITGTVWQRSGQTTTVPPPPPSPPPPPGGTTCPGSNPPTEPIPGGAGNGNGHPSGPNPGGCPLPTDPHQPPAPADHHVYGHGNAAEPPVPH